MNEMKMKKIIEVLNSLNKGNTFTEEDLYQKIKLGGRSYVEKINSMLLRARRMDLLISKEEFEFIKNCCKMEEILLASTIDYDESHYQEVEFTEPEVQDTKDIRESQQILSEGKIEKIVKVLNSLNRGNTFTEEELYQKIKLDGKKYIEKINSMLLRARRKDLFLTQEEFDLIKNQDEVEEIFPTFEYDESPLPMAEFTSIDTKDVLNSEWQKILNNPKNYDTLLGRKKTIDEILTSKLPPNVSSIREEEILEKKQYFFDSIVEFKTYWREMWKSDFSVNQLLDDFFFITEEEAELIFDACNEEEKALYNDYFNKLHEIEEMIFQYQDDFEDLQNLDEVSGKLLLRLFSSRDRKKFLNIFKEKKAIFKKVNKVDFEQLEKDAFVYGYYKSCKKLLKNDSLKMKDVKSFAEESKTVKEKFEAMIGNEDKSLNYMQGITHATSKANEKDVNSVLNSNQDVSEKKSFLDYLDSLKKEKRIEWQNVVDRSKRFMTSVRNLSFVERFKLKDHYEAVKHPIKRKLVYGGLVAGSVLSFFGGLKACSSKSLKNDIKVEDTKHVGFEAQNLFSNIKIEQPETKKIFAENVLGDFEKKETIESKRKELTEMREKIVTLQSIVTEKAKTQNVVVDEILFGDVVNLKNNSVLNYPDIYSATYEQNGSQSYFGNSLERVVDSIFFSKDGEVMNTHTYEEYQNALAQGYTLEGYTLVNQNSLNPENLIVEGRYVKEDVTLVRK